MSEPINNYQFDLQYESYKQYITSLQTVYFRLKFNFPEHKMFKYWSIRQEHWRNYEKIKQGYKAFNSIEELENEVSKILPEHLLSEALEKELIRNKKA